MVPVRIQDLIQRFLADTITDSEEEELSRWIESQPDDDSLLEALTTGFDQQQTDLQMPAGMRERILSTILPAKRTPVVRMKSWRIAAAACLLLLAGIGGYLFFNTNSKPNKPLAALSTNDVKAPQTNRAMITLANGTIVYLDSADNGTLATQQNVQLIKNGDGKIEYSTAAPSPLERAGGEVFNTLSNPRGSKIIDMTLSDGSHVWLNAASSITYPVAFTGTERKVSITGEAYFEVAHNASKPFYVSKGDMEVKVLGTHFNVNAYDDEDDIRVTLLEGSVKISLPTANRQLPTILKPGEQAAITHNPIAIGSQPDSYRVTTHHPDLDEVMAWKNGLFQMNNSDIPTIMRQLARWYDIDITYPNGIPGGHITGKVPETTTLANLLKVFEYSGVQFKIEGRRLIVLK